MRERERERRKKVAGNMKRKKNEMYFSATFPKENIVKIGDSIMEVNDLHLMKNGRRRRYKTKNEGKKKGRREIRRKRKEGEKKDEIENQSGGERKKEEKEKN